MEAESGRARDSLILHEALARAPWQFDFFQALRRIECAHPQQPRLGKALRPSEEPVRLAQQPSLAFAPSTLGAYSAQKHGLPPRLEQFFFGVLGPNGPLPRHLTEHALTRIAHHADPTFSRFLDVFHHRMLLLFYRAWAEAQPVVSADRQEDDRFSFYLGALAGSSTAHLRARDEVPDAAKLHFTGVLARQVRNAEGLAAVLEAYFRVKVRVEQFVLHWLKLATDQRTALGGLPRASIALGQASVLGARVRDVQAKFRIRLGPLSASRYESFLPGSRSLAALVAWVRNHLGFEFDWDVVLILARDQVAGVELGRSGRLGWTSWLGAWRKPHDAHDLVLAPERERCAGKE